MQYTHVINNLASDIFKYLRFRGEICDAPVLGIVIIYDDKGDMNKDKMQIVLKELEGVKNGIINPKYPHPTMSAHDRFKMWLDLADGHNNTPSKMQVLHITTDEKYYKISSSQQSMDGHRCCINLDYFKPDHTLIMCSNNDGYTRNPIATNILSYLHTNVQEPSYCPIRGDVFIYNKHGDITDEQIEFIMGTLSKAKKDFLAKSSPYDNNPYPTNSAHYLRLFAKQCEKLGYESIGLELP
jgi:hypothetical protein